MDLAKEIENHLEWIDSIAALLEVEEFSDVDFQKITSHDDCELGHWLSAEGSELYNTLPEFNKLIDSHEAFHKLAGELVAAIRAGDEKKAVEVQEGFISMSQEVVGHLQRLQEVSEDS